MKNLFFTLLLCVGITCAGMDTPDGYEDRFAFIRQDTYNEALTQKDMFKKLEYQMGCMDHKKVMDLLTKWKDRFDINVGCRPLLHEVMRYKISELRYSSLRNHHSSYDSYQQLYLHIIKLFKNKIDLNVQNGFGNTVLHAMIDDMNVYGGIDQSNEKKIENCLEEFVMEFKDTIDFTSTNKKGRTVFDLCAANPLEIREEYQRYKLSEAWNLQKKYIARQNTTQKILLNVYITYRDSIQK